MVLVQGHFAGYLPLCSRNEPVFLALCTPVAMPETRECVVQGSTHVFTSIHSMDMKILHLDRNGEFHLGYQKSSLQGVSWYELVHWDHLSDVQSKHKLSKYRIFFSILFFFIRISYLCLCLISKSLNQ